MNETTRHKKMIHFFKLYFIKTFLFKSNRESQKDIKQPKTLSHRVQRSAFLSFCVSVFVLCVLLCFICLCLTYNNITLLWWSFLSLLIGICSHYVVVLGPSKHFKPVFVYIYSFFSPFFLEIYLYLLIYYVFILFWN